MISSVAHSHDYFFSFTEMEYNDVTRKFEVTITVSTHDLELAYEKNGDIKLDLEYFESQSETTILLKDYFKNHFRIQTENEKCVLNLIAYESSLNGTTNFYFESESIDITHKLTLRNDILMDQYQQQQNKITLYYRSKSYTNDFLSNEKIQTIILN